VVGLPPLEAGGQGHVAHRDVGKERGTSPLGAGDGHGVPQPLPILAECHHHCTQPKLAYDLWWICPLGRGIEVVVGGGGGPQFSK